MPNPRARGVEWFYIEADTKISPGLAVTQDGDKRPGESLHDTIAPKDNMPFDLFLPHLKGLEAIFKKQATQGQVVIQVSMQTLLHSLHAVAKERKAVGARLDAGDYSDDELDELNDRTEQLTMALSELGDLYEPQREGQEQVYPSVEKILAAYDEHHDSVVREGRQSATSGQLRPTGCCLAVGPTTGSEGR